MQKNILQAIVDNKVSIVNMEVKESINKHDISPLHHKHVCIYARASKHARQSSIRLLQNTVFITLIKYCYL